MERFLRFDLDKTSHRAFAVLHPVKLTLTNKKANEVTWLKAPLIPGNPTAGIRELPYQREVYVEREDVKSVSYTHLDVYKRQEKKVQEPWCF